MSWDPIWETIFSNQQWGQYPAEDLIRFIAGNFYKCPIRSKIKVLEVGSGPGANLCFLAKEGFSVYGVEGSSTAISKARERLNRECENWAGELHVGDIGLLPFGEKTFDAVIDSEAIYANSFQSSQNIYRELFRVLKPGGKLYSRTFAEGSSGDGTGENVGHNSWKASQGPLANKGYSRFTSFSEIPQLLGDFHIESVEQVTRTFGNRTQEVREWLIFAQRPVE